MNIEYKIGVVKKSLNDIFFRSKRIIEDTDNGYITCDPDVLDAYKKTVRKMEAAADILDDQERFIIENEVFSKNDGSWYKLYYSKSYYYRVRKMAFKNYLDCLRWI